MSASQLVAFLLVCGLLALLYVLQCGSLKYHQRDGDPIGRLSRHLSHLLYERTPAWLRQHAPPLAALLARIGGRSPLLQVCASSRCLALPRAASRSPPPQSPLTELPPSHHLVSHVLRALFL
jgi:hypothetical protein